MFIRNKSNRGIINILLILVIVFAIGMIAFGLIAVLNYNSANKEKKNLVNAQNESYNKGANDQKEIDKKAFEETAKDPYRSYIAPAKYGSFEIKFPKSWNGYIAEEESSTIAIRLLLNPNFVVASIGSSNVSGTYALRVTLSSEKYSDLVSRYQALISKGGLTAKNIKVSEINAIRFDGSIDTLHKGVVTIIPIRDKTLIVQTDDNKYITDYNKILSEIKINP